MGYMCKCNIIKWVGLRGVVSLQWCSKMLAYVVRLQFTPSVSVGTFYDQEVSLTLCLANVRFMPKLLHMKRLVCEM